LHQRVARLLAVLTLVLMSAACSEEGAGDSHAHDHAHPAPDAGYAFGEPGDPEASEREIEVDAVDPTSFDPARIEVQAGETVTFVVTNTGDIEHEFVLGDEDFQEGHHEAMSQDGHGGDTEYAVTLAPGETKEVVWRFTQEGDLQYACHVAGHYESGMFGVVTVTG